MSETSNLSDARLGVIDTLRGVLLDLADYQDLPAEQKTETLDNIGEVVNIMLDVLDFQIVDFDPTTGAATVTVIIPQY